jgi:hypothetical protein
MRAPPPQQLQLDLSHSRPERPTQEQGGSLPASCTNARNTAESGSRAHSRCHSAAELLQMPGAVLTRSHLRELGWERRGVDAIFRALPVVAVDGYSRPVIQVDDYLQLMERSTFHDDRVRPLMHTAPAPALSSRSNG